MAASSTTIAIMAFDSMEACLSPEYRYNKITLIKRETVVDLELQIYKLLQWSQEARETEKGVRSTSGTYKLLYSEINLLAMLATGSAGAKGI